ncbi:MAG TPA: hypothetical protein VKE42_12260 [Candidatus Cybelea sp.]|nr:hypothetical protein [Candidatus Cybelea sp.]
MTPEQRKEFRRAIGHAVINIQAEQMATGQPPEIVIPELIAALLSLAAHVSHDNMYLTRERFDLACRLAADEEWMPVPPDGRMQ